MNMRNQDLTQKFSTWGDKLLQHTDTLYSIQKDRKFKPITIQLSPVEQCENECTFCSVAERPLSNFMPWDKLEKCLRDFRKLGAKAVEITGGGNPMLYRDKEHGKDINSIISLASDLGYDIGIITNSLVLRKLRPELFPKINWLRVSLAMLDIGKNPDQYDFNGFPQEKMGFSYIIDDETEDGKGKLKPTEKTSKILQKISQLVKLYPKVKFVRIAGNCLVKGNNAQVATIYNPLIDTFDNNEKFFIKDIGNDDGPFNDSCYVGMVRPYVASSPNGDGYRVYTCTSHVLNKRNYDLDFSLCSIDDVTEAWALMNQRFGEGKAPYEVRCNGGKNWESSCKYCYYKFNNRLLHTVANEMPDKNFA